MPLSSDSRINKDEVLDLLEEALTRLPEELRAARWLLKERDDFLTRTEHEAEEILDQARTRVERMITRTEVVKAAEHRAYAHRRRRRGRGPADAPRGRGLLRPAAGALRGDPRAHHEDGRGRPREAADGEPLVRAGLPRRSRRGGRRRPRRRSAVGAHRLLDPAAAATGADPRVAAARAPLPPAPPAGEAAFFDQDTAE